MKPWTADNAHEHPTFLSCHFYIGSTMTNIGYKSLSTLRISQSIQTSGFPKRSAVATSCGAWLLPDWRGCWSSSPSPRLGSSSSFPQLFLLTTRCPSHLSPPSRPALSRARCPISPTSSRRNCCLTKRWGREETGRKRVGKGNTKNKIDLHHYYVFIIIYTYFTQPPC